MKGLEVSVEYALLSEKKWDTFSYNFADLAAEFSDTDKKIIKKLNHVAGGELCGFAMMFRLYELCRLKSELGNLSLFYEAIFYSANTITYEEFRHGLVLKELNTAISGEPSFIRNISPEDVARDYFMVKPVWETPMEALVSFTVGEITNIVLYSEAAKAADHPTLKQILMNISKDEYKHKTAWRAICKKIVESSPEARAQFISAFRKAHYVHQAEVYSKYAEGLNATKDFFTSKIIMDIFEEKIALLKDIVGENFGFDPKELLDSQLRHIGSLA